MEVSDCKIHSTWLTSRSDFVFMCPIEVSVFIGNTDNFTSVKMFYPRIKAWKYANHSSIKGTRRAKKPAKFKFTFYVYKCKLKFKWWQQPKCVNVELQWVMMGIQPQFQKMDHGFFFATWICGWHGELCSQTTISRKWCCDFRQHLFHFRSTVYRHCFFADWGEPLPIITSEKLSLPKMLILYPIMVLTS